MLRRGNIELLRLPKYIIYASDCRRIHKVVVFGENILHSLWCDAAESIGSRFNDGLYAL